MRLSRSQLTSSPQLNSTHSPLCVCVRLLHVWSHVQMVCIMACDCRKPMEFCIGNHWHFCLSSHTLLLAVCVKCCKLWHEFYRVNISHQFTFARYMTSVSAAIPLVIKCIYRMDAQYYWRWTNQTNYYVHHPGGFSAIPDTHHTHTRTHTVAHVRELLVWVISMGNFNDFTLKSRIRQLKPFNRKMVAQMIIFVQRIHMMYVFYVCHIDVD